MPHELRPLFDIDGLAAYLNVPKETIYRWRRTRFGPPAVKLGKYLRWRPEDVDAWITDQQQAAGAG